jgi:S-adenosylmethionine decarboxylase
MTAQINELSFWLAETDDTKLFDFIERLLYDSEHEILQRTEHHFEPQGFTALWLLGESHCALHTFPEAGRSYIQLASCSLEKFKVFKRLLLNTNGLEMTGLVENKSLPV